MKYLVIAAVILFFGSCSNQEATKETAKSENVELVSSSHTGTYSKIEEESHLTWRATHLAGIQPRYGKVFIKNANFGIENGELVKAEVQVNLSSLTVENFPEGAEEIEKLRGHLLSADFFNISQFPEAKFELTNLSKNEGDFNSIATGNLTILGVSKPVSFNANVQVSEKKLSIQSEKFSIDRTDWGLSYNIEGTEGVPVDYLIANDIEFEIDLSVTK